MPIAVVDIGSNSVRLVIYDRLQRTPNPVVNEKILCGLARGLGVTGTLDPNGTLLAERAIARFVKLCRLSDVRTLYLFATAAVRDARDGKAFVKKLEARHGIHIEVLTGEEEARTAAFGVISCVPDAEGVVGDLGGGSLELIGVRKSQPDALCRSFPIGPLRLLATVGKESAAWKKAIDAALDQYPLREKLQGKCFYAVGGALRNLGRIHMVRHHYPLAVLDHYTVNAAPFLQTLRSIIQMTPRELEKIEGIPKRRMDILPIAALVAERILAAGKPAEIMFSVYGVREGYLLGKLPKEERAKDPLIAGCYDMISRVPANPTYGEELAAWMDPLFKKEDAVTHRLRLAACMLSELSRFESTEYKAELAYRRVLDSALIGLRHAERAFLARALYHRYRREDDDAMLSPIQQLLTRAERTNALQMGLMMRLAYAISGAQAGVLPHTELSKKADHLTLVFDPSVSDLAGEAVEKRLRILADSLRLTPRISFSKKVRG